MASFVDEVIIQARAGDGGNGAVAWRREAHIPRGGPAGGDGGDGGDVVFDCDDNVHSLLDFKFKPHLTARAGGAGRGKNQAGVGGAHAIARVPVGTQIFDADDGTLLADLTAAGTRFVACKGGSGGFGNSRFATPSRQAPEFAKPGLPGEARRLRLSLKVLADVGLLGFPNAGKSTLLSRVSAARPKIADYPFTTLVPQLGVVRVDDDMTFVMADIPGLIEGASEGAGLGIRFLKHLERVRILCHLVEIPLELAAGDASAALDGVLVERHRVLRGELAAFSEELAQLPEIVVVNKVDMLGDGARPEDHPAVRALRRALDESRTPLLFASTATGDGLDAVLYALGERVRATRAPRPAPAAFDPLAGMKLR